MRRLHRFAVGLASGIVLLIAAGGLVKSLEAGLSVPDWPLSYGTLNPPRWWQIQNVRAEHGHRLLAGTVALLTVGLAVWAGRVERRRWVRRLAWAAVAAVLAQAVLGGVTVLFFLPPAISVSHAALAELFLCLVVALAVVTSRRWRLGAPKAAPRAGLAPAATVTSALIYLQILLGAVVRHTGAGLAIPDFPLAFGRLVPPEFTFPIAVHYAHRVGALAVTVAIGVTVWRALRGDRADRGLILPALALVGLVAAQVTLGALVVLSARAVPLNTAHVATGAALLATSVVLTLEAWRSARAPRAAVRTAPAAALAEGG